MRRPEADPDGRNEGKRSAVNVGRASGRPTTNQLEIQMARIRIQDENREITGTQEICAFLQPFGIWYEKWDVAGRIGPEATNEEILTAYAPEVDRLKKAGNFVTADVINVSPATPN